MPSLRLFASVKSCSRKRNGGFVVSHRDDASLDQLQTYQNAEDAVEIAKYDDAGNYRPLKTAPNLRHGWRLELATVEECEFAGLFLSRPARGFRGVEKRLPQNDGLARDTGSSVRNVSRCRKNFRSTNQRSCGGFCRSDSGCLRTILWKRDRNGVIASTKLPKEKFDPAYDQVMACSRRPAGEERASIRRRSTPARQAAKRLQFLCFARKRAIFSSPNAAKW